MHDQLRALRLDDLQVVQHPAARPASETGLRFYLPLGLVAGFAWGISAAAIASRRRDVYIVAREVERHLGLPELARVTLRRDGSDTVALLAGIRVLATRVRQASDQAGAPVATLHVAGLADPEGAEAIAQTLADELATAHGLRILVLFMGRSPRDGDGCLGLVSVAEAWSAADRPAAALPGSALTVIDEDGPKPLGATQIARALLGDAEAEIGLHQPQIAQLQAAHDLILVVSGAGTAASVAGRLSALADCDLIVVRAEESRAGSTLTLRRALVAAGDRTLGFVFTDARTAALGIRA